jgi:hypothetical protein
MWGESMERAMLLDVKRVGNPASPGIYFGTSVVAWSDVCTCHRVQGKISDRFAPTSPEARSCQS